MGTQFEDCMYSAEKRLRNAQSAFNIMKALYKKGHVGAAFEAAFDFAEECEKLTLLARVLPAYTGNPNAAQLTDSMRDTHMRIDIEITGQGWFKLTLPALLPKKERGSADYIRSSLYAAMRRFFSGRQPVYYPDSVIIFRHIYNRDRPERRYRDHDNIEINTVVDILALYLLRDDMPSLCTHYYFSEADVDDRTEVYVLPQEEFTAFLDVVKTTQNDKNRPFLNPP